MSKKYEYLKSRVEVINNFDEFIYSMHFIFILSIKSINNFQNLIINFYNQVKLSETYDIISFEKKKT